METSPGGIPLFVKLLEFSLNRVEARECCLENLAAHKHLILDRRIAENWGMENQRLGGPSSKWVFGQAIQLGSMCQIGMFHQALYVCWI